ncbi:MAG: GNAT family N-acetyltransferase, partial [Coxiella sp. (in: Bacteria)]
MIFETPRLYTRPWQASDIDAAIQLWGDPKVTALISAKGQLSNEDANEKLDEQINIQQQYDLSSWALVLKETDA